ncbi:MAG: hypothetical protein PF518_08730 [Spirochaetaceae bacterium]|jgi:hypothetical protein|nr:hypothetical protein [Spirochaetaceae bacterium]
MNIHHATKSLATSLCILSGIASIIHGFFEVLQGNVSIKAGRILAIGPSHRFWEFGGEPALTIIPNYLITGIFSIAISITLFIWAFAFIDKKHNITGLIVLTILMLLFGGGLAPPTFMILAIIASIFIKRPVKFRLSTFAGRQFKTLFILWPWILYVLIFLVIIAIIAGVSGYPFLFLFIPENTIKILRIYGQVVAFILGPITIFSALSYDAKTIE